jgi:hypothetical protein
LLIQNILKIVELNFFLGPRVFHLLVDGSFPRDKLLILLFQRDEPVLEVNDLSESFGEPLGVSLFVFVICRAHALQKVREKFVFLKILLLLLKLNLSASFESL